MCSSRRTRRGWNGCRATYNSPSPRSAVCAHAISLLLLSSQLSHTCSFSVVSPACCISLHLLVSQWAPWTLCMPLPLPCDPTPLVPPPTMWSHPFPFLPSFSSSALSIPKLSNNRCLSYLFISETGVQLADQLHGRPSLAALGETDQGVIVVGVVK